MLKFATYAAMAMLAVGLATAASKPASAWGSYGYYRHHHYGYYRPFYRHHYYYGYYRHRPFYRHHRYGY